MRVRVAMMGHRTRGKYAMSGGLAGPNAYDIFAGLSKAVLRLPKMARGDSGITETDARNEKGMTVRPAIYANRQICMGLWMSRPYATGMF